MEDQAKKEFGSRVKMAREKKGYTQEELAALLGVGVTHISHIENGKCYPSVELLISMMNALAVQPNYLFCGTCDETAPELLKETAEIYEGLSITDAQHFNEVLRLLKSRL